MGNRREWFDGKRLSTEEQDKLVEMVRKDPETRSTSTGDTLVRVDLGFFTVYRQDFCVQLTAKELKDRPWSEQ